MAVMVFANDTNELFELECTYVYTDDEGYVDGIFDLIGNAMYDYSIDEWEVSDRVNRLFGDTVDYEMSHDDVMWWRDWASNAWAIESVVDRLERKDPDIRERLNELVRYMSDLEEIQNTMLDELHINRREGDCEAVLKDWIVEVGRFDGDDGECVVYRTARGYLCDYGSYSDVTWANDDVEAIRIFKDRVTED